MLCSGALHRPPFLAGHSDLLRSSLRVSGPPSCCSCSRILRSGQAVTSCPTITTFVPASCPGRRLAPLLGMPSFHLLFESSPFSKTSPNPHLPGSSSMPALPCVAVALAIILSLNPWPFGLSYHFMCAWLVSPTCQSSHHVEWKGTRFGAQGLPQCPGINFPLETEPLVVVRLTLDTGYEPTHVCGAQSRPSSSSGLLPVHSTWGRGVLGEHGGCRCEFQALLVSLQAPGRGG